MTFDKSRPLRAVFPGSFDPVTFGHIDIVRRFAPFFDLLTVLVASSPHKKYRFSLSERTAAARAVFKDFPKTAVDSGKGLTADYALKNGASFILRGARSVTDFEMEKSMAWHNRKVSGPAAGGPAGSGLAGGGGPLYGPQGGGSNRGGPNLGGPATGLGPSGGPNLAGSRFAGSPQRAAALRASRFDGGLETILVFPRPETEAVSGRLVKEIAAAGGDLSGLIPQEAVRMFAVADKKEKG